jgi:hypothetical protein
MHTGNPTEAPAEQRAVHPTREKTLKTLPKTLPGVDCAQRVRCGKPNWHCAAGQRHLAYNRFWSAGGRLRKRYVPRADLERVRAVCAARRETRRAWVQSWGLWRQLESVVREAERE